jgi:exopolysaccharide biosynthesis polyprenyl glycosylphosphotransferase
MTPVQDARMPSLVAESSSLGKWDGDGATVGEKPADAAAHGRRARDPSQPWLAALMFLGLDVAVWIAIYGFFSFLRHDAFYTTPLQFAVVDLIQLATIVTALLVVGGYNRHTDMRTLSFTTEYILALMSAAVLSALLIYSAATYDQSMNPSRAILLLSFVVFTAVSLEYRRIIGSYLIESTAASTFLVIGSGEAATRFYEAYRSSGNRQRLEFVDLASQRIGEPIAGPGSPIVEGDIATKLERLDKNYSGVILAERVDRMQPELLERLVRTQFHNARVYTLESFYEAHWRHVPVLALDPFWPLQTGFQLARNSPYHYVKRLFDLALAALLLIICSPLLLLICGAVWLGNGRPVLFRQPRVGRENRLFTILKFRTMRTRASGAELSVNGSQLSGTAGEESEEDMYTREGDPRVTPVGRWLRKLRLDELPQLWNVLRGDMSLIGPRAEWIKCAERYEQKIPFYHFRHLVKPGITGWAQVNYPYGESDEDAIEKLKYDLYYIRHYSLKLDAMIVLKTVHTVLFGKGR